jgi:hypothetical protein
MYGETEIADAGEYEKDSILVTGCTGSQWAVHTDDSVPHRVMPGYTQ